MFKKTLICCLPIIAFTVLQGCGPQEEVSTRTVVRQQEPRQPMDVEAIKKNLQHTLVAVLPVEEKAWFFKSSGPAAQIESIRDDFLKFISTLKPAEGADSPPAWQLPEGWQESGPARMRAATVKIPTENGEVEIAVSSLPLTGEWDAFLFKNVQRWMRQLKQGPLSEETIQKIAEEVDTKAGKATVLHLLGFGDPKAPNNPHAGMAKSTPESSPPKQAPEEKEPAAAPPTGPIDYEAPKGWQPGRMNSMRAAALQLVDGDLKAEMVVTRFPANPAMTDPVGNVQRWSREVGVSGVDKQFVEKISSPIKIDGNSGTLFELLGDEAQPQSKATLVAMIVRGELAWFFKLHGDRQIVLDQQEVFKKFLKSVSFK